MSLLHTTFRGHKITPYSLTLPEPSLTMQIVSPHRYYTSFQDRVYIISICTLNTLIVQARKVKKTENIKKIVPKYCQEEEKLFCYYACLTFLNDPTAGLFAPSLLSLYPMADFDRSSFFLAVEKILSPSLRALDALLPPERIDQPRRDGVSARAGVRGTLGWS